MTRSKITLMLTLGTASLLFASDATHAESSVDASITVVSPEISEVRAYPYAAEVIRKFRVNTRLGNSRIVVKELPTNVTNFNVQALGMSDYVRVVDTRQNTYYEKEAFSDRVRELDRQIAELEKTIAEHQDEISSINMQVDLLNGIVSEYPQQEMPDSPVNGSGIERTRGVLTLVRESSKIAFDSRREVGTQLDQAKQLRQQLQIERAQTGGQQRESAELSFGIVATEEKETEFKVSYFVSQARWHSNYHAYFNSETRQLRILHDAIVKQRSAEPWSEVALVLTTANPEFRTAPPQQYSQFVDLVQPEPMEEIIVTGSRLPREDASLSAPSDIIVDVIHGKFDLSTLVFDFSTEYRTAIAQSVPNDYSEHGIVGLGTYEFDDIDITTTVVPRHSDIGYLSARFNYAESAPLPTGNVKCFVDGSFIGEVIIETIHPNEDVVIPMGVDRSIRVAMENQGDVKGDKGLFRNRKVQETHFLLTVENRRSSSAKVEVLDYYPVARHEDIKVEVHREATPPTERDIDNKPGRISWKKELKPGEVWTIRQRYSVSYPSDSVISLTGR